MRHNPADPLFIPSLIRVSPFPCFSILLYGYILDRRRVKTITSTGLDTSCCSRSECWNVASVICNAFVSRLRTFTAGRRVSAEKETQSMSHLSLRGDSACLPVSLPLKQLCSSWNRQTTDQCMMKKENNDYIICFRILIQSVILLTTFNVVFKSYQQMLASFFSFFVRLGAFPVHFLPAGYSTLCYPCMCPSVGIAKKAPLGFYSTVSR